MPKTQKSEFAEAYKEILGKILLIVSLIFGTSIPFVLMVSSTGEPYYDILKTLFIIIVGMFGPLVLVAFLYYSLKLMMLFYYSLVRMIYGEK